MCVRRSTSPVFYLVTVVVFILRITTGVCFGGEISDLSQQALDELKRREFDSAVDDFSRLIRTNASSAYYLGRGMAYSGLREHDRAIDDLDRAILLSPTAAAFACRGSAYSLMGDFEKAAHDYGEAIQRKPENGVFYYERACAYGQSHLYNAAIIDSSSAILMLGGANSNVFLISAYCLRGEMYSKINNDKCFADFQKAIQLDPGHYVAYLHRGDAYAIRNKHTQAIDDYTEVIKLDPKNSLAYASRGVMYACEGDYAKGIDDCYRGIQVEPASGLALAKLAWILAVCPDAKYRDGQKALKYGKKACELTAWKKAECINSLAAAEAEVGHFDEAVKWLNKCKELDYWSEKDSDKFRKRLELYRQGKPFHEEVVNRASQ